MPQVLGWVYFSFLNALSLLMQDPTVRVSGVSVRTMFSGSPPFFIALIAIATFGYLFNDLCDVKADLISGKTNNLSGIKPFIRWILVLIPLSIGISCWVVMDFQSSGHKFWPNLLFTAQICSLVVYSAKPFRLKERAEFGVICDAFYGHLNPILITILVFGIIPQSGVWRISFIAILAFVCFVKGIRNILLHQIEDRKKDEAAGLNTAGGSRCSRPKW